MLSGELLTQIQSLAEDATAKADEYSGVIGSIQQVILEHFGQNGLYATYIALAAVILFVISKLAKLTFSTLKYLVIPALVLAFAGSFFVPYSFVSLLPVSVAVCSVFLLFKG